MRKHGTPQLTPAAVTAALRGDPDNALLALQPGAIESQERAGQITSNLSSTLPKQCDRATLESFGIVFGEPADDLFVKVKLPAGWSKKGTDHAMYSDLLDDKGRRRAQIFYKAAFYDRRADVRVIPRYSVQEYHPCDAEGNTVPYGKQTHFRTVALDGDTVLQAFGEIRPDAAWSKESSELTELQRSDAVAWLTQKFPEWRNEAAYWD